MQICPAIHCIDLIIGAGALAQSLISELSKVFTGTVCLIGENQSVAADCVFCQFSQVPRFHRYSSGPWGWVRSHNRLYPSWNVNMAHAMHTEPNAPTLSKSPNPKW